MANLSNNRVETRAGLGHESNASQRCIYINLIFTLRLYVNVMARFINL